MGYRGTVGKRLMLMQVGIIAGIEILLVLLLGADIFVTNINTASINDIYRIATNSDN